MAGDCMMSLFYITQTRDKIPDPGTQQPIACIRLQKGAYINKTTGGLGCKPRGLGNCSQPPPRQSLMILITPYTIFGDSS